MISLFLNRIFRSVKIDPEVFNEVQKDKNATISAAIVVILSSSAAGIGAASLGASNFLLAPVFSLISWFVWEYIVILLVLNYFPTQKLKLLNLPFLELLDFQVHLE